MWEAISPYLTALLPTAGVLVVVYVVFKTIFEADRRERKAVAEWERSHDASPISSTDDESRPAT